MDKYLDLYRIVSLNRKLDDKQEALAQSGKIPFYIPTAGHETSAALAPHLRPDDYLFCHYRDVALMLARGYLPENLLAGVLGRAGSSSSGRRMPGFPCSPELRIMDSSTLVGNNALQAAGIAHTIKTREGDQSIVLCSIGDGGTQQGEYLEAIAEAVRWQLPVLFFVHNNNYALSVPTPGKTFFSRGDGLAREFYGIEIVHLEGRNIPAAHERLGQVVGEMRERRHPRIVVLNTERLRSHTYADDHRVYRAEADLKRLSEEMDPLRCFRQYLLDSGVAEATLAEIEQAGQKQIELAATTALAMPVSKGKTEIRCPYVPLRTCPPVGSADAEQLTLLQTIRRVLAHRLEHDDRVVLYGQDIEDPKGDVFGLTRGLSKAYPERVRNSPLSESTIMGVAAGRAFAGDRPVAFLQFADFLPLAYNQIHSELGSIYWRSNGNFEAPVTVLTVSGAYCKGLGPFHAQTPAAAVAHVPGVDVYVPGCAADAAAILNTAMSGNRPSVILLPKVLLNSRAHMATLQDLNVTIRPGEARRVREGSELTLVGYGSTMLVCEEAADHLERAGISVELIDLRCISPWDEEMIVESVSRTGALLIVDEDNKTCGIAGEILATVAERIDRKVKLARECLNDTFIPFEFGRQLEILPTVDTVLERVARMLDLQVEWEEDEQAAAGTLVVKTVGSSPADETVTIMAYHVEVGDVVEEDDLLATVEADKAITEITAPTGGTVTAISLEVGDEVSIGTPMLVLATGVDAEAGPVVETPSERRVHAITRKSAAGAATRASASGKTDVYLSAIAAVPGSRLVLNEELIEHNPVWSASEIEKRTGIRQRYWVGEGETTLSLAERATREVLRMHDLAMEDVDAIICSTGTGGPVSPSMACRLLTSFDLPDSVAIQAHDINAACSGYLYALQQAYDILQFQADAVILIVTSETLSQVLDRTDPGTYFLFGDAATASLVTGTPLPGSKRRLKVSRPVLSSGGDPKEALFVPNLNMPEFLRMDGRPVFRVAVKNMLQMLQRACKQSELTVADLDLVIPHQANQRIIEAVQKTASMAPERVYSCIANYGNTSSSSIPLALSELAKGSEMRGKLGLTAFGAGFAFGAALLDASDL